IAGCATSSISNGGPHFVPRADPAPRAPPAPGGRRRAHGCRLSGRRVLSSLVEASGMRALPAFPLSVAVPSAACATEGDRVASKLHVPHGFEVNLFAEDLPGVRFLAVGPGGEILATLTRQGRVVALPDANHDGRADRVVSVADGLDLPHGIE